MAASKDGGRTYEDNERRLVAAVVLRAVRDMKQGRPARRAEAEQWLRDAGAGYASAILGCNPGKIIQWLDGDDQRKDSKKRG